MVQEISIFFSLEVIQLQCFKKSKMINVFRIETNKKEMLLHLLLSSQVEIQLTK